MPRADTIAATATPRGPGGIGIVRVSGPEAHTVAKKVFRTESSWPMARTACLGRVVDDERGSVLDRCLLTLFFGPESYTGEDVAEFSCHGSMPVLQRLLELLARLGVRPAGRGEFTLRAFLNGKLDLAQAEAVNRLVRARTLRQAEDAVRQLEGRISEQSRKIDEALMDVFSRMAAAVDFAEEGQEFIHREGALGIIREIEGGLAEMISKFKRADLVRDGALAVIAGASNVGKSTLFNALLKRERSIVDASPGTTRDYIAETIELDGLPVTLVDTAGLRDGGELVEIDL